MTRSEFVCLPAEIALLIRYFLSNVIEKFAHLFMKVGSVFGCMRKLVRKAVRIFSEEGAFHAVYAITYFLTPGPYDRYVWLVNKEVEERASNVPLRDRLEMFRWGFKSRVYYLYDFDGDERYRDYVSCLSRYFETAAINSEPELLNEKDKFYEVMGEEGFRDYLPDIFGRIEDGVFHGTYGNLLDLLRQEKRVVIKGITGSGGTNVHTVETDDGGVLWDGAELSESEFERELSELHDSIVTAYCEECDLLDSIYPTSANTLRILTMNPSDGEAFIATAILRVGTSKSGHVDNFSRGGLSVDVDLETGELGRAAERLPNHEVRYRGSHPDTGAQIEGTEIPGWVDIKAQLLEIANSIPELKYVGWDLVVTEPGEFAIIEGNNRSDVDLLQVHGPLLADERVREFYDENGVSVGRF